MKLAVFPPAFLRLLVLMFFLMLAQYSQAFGPVPDVFPRGIPDHYLTLPNGDVMHYYDEGNPQGKPVLMVHGYPTSAFLYRHIIAELCPDRQSEYRCIAMTHIGFGKSSCPGDGSAIGPVYEVARLEEFIQQLNLQDTGLIVHDWGGPIGTLAGLRHHERISHLVILNTMLTFPESELLAELMDWAEQWFGEERPLIEHLYDRYVAVGMQALTNHYLRWSELAVYRAPFNGPDGACRTHAGVNLFARAHADEALFTEIAQRAQADWQTKPTVIFWGLDDPLFGNRTNRGVEVHERIEGLFPQADTIVFDANHFMQEDQPQGIAAEIRTFIPGY